MPEEANCNILGPPVAEAVGGGEGGASERRPNSGHWERCLNTEANKLN